MQQEILNLDTPAAQRLPPWLVALFCTLVLASVVTLLRIVWATPTARPDTVQIIRPQRVLPKTEVPKVEPMRLQEVAATDARAFNATIPYSKAPNPAARPFRIFGDAEDQRRATDCLASAILYEAGNDPNGQTAVAQVVLNRVRHPAFPKSVCGVVYQGQERKTGCQFSFTCDGSLARTYSDAAWMRAQAVADRALHGQIDKRVGHATHYHTDWVVPYWSSSLDKIVDIHTHLFFRWSGWWGKPPAFDRAYAGTEPVVAKLARISAAHRLALESGVGMLGAEINAGLPINLAVTSNVTGFDNETLLVTLEPNMTRDQFLAAAASMCADRAYCKLMAWTEKAETPTMLPVNAQQQQTMAFSYVRSRADAVERALWNCNRYRGLPSSQCRTAPTSIASAFISGPSANPESSLGPRPAGAADSKKPSTALPPTVPARRSAGKPPSDLLRKPVEAPMPNTGKLIPSVPSATDR